MERNSLSQEEISFFRGKFSVTGRHKRHILSQKEFSSQKTKLRAIRRNFLWQEEIFCHRTEFPVTGSNFLSKKILLSSKDQYYAFYLNLNLYCQKSGKTNLILSLGGEKNLARDKKKYYPTLFGTHCTNWISQLYQVVPARGYFSDFISLISSSRWEFDTNSVFNQQEIKF